MHAVTKNLQSVRDQARFEDFLCEVNALSYDVLFVSETWRDAHEEMFKTTRGEKLFFSGGSRGQGVWQMRCCSSIYNKARLYEKAVEGENRVP